MAGSFLSATRGRDESSPTEARMFGIVARSAAPAPERAASMHLLELPRSAQEEERRLRQIQSNTSDVAEEAAWTKATAAASAASFMSVRTASGADATVAASGEALVESPSG